MNLNIAIIELLKIVVKEQKNKPFKTKDKR